MKKIFLLLIGLLLLVGCSTKKKISEVERMYSKQTEISDVENVSSQVTIDTTRISDREVTYTKVTYFDPVDGKPPDAKKEVESWTIKDTTTKKGFSDSTVTNSKETKSAEAIQEDTIESFQEEPAQDPYKWRYIFYIIISLIGIFIFIKRKSVFKAITKIISKMFLL